MILFRTRQIRMVGILLFCLLLSLTLSGCAEKGVNSTTAKETPLGTSIPKYSINWTVGVNSDSDNLREQFAELELKIEPNVNSSDLRDTQVILSNPDGKTVGKTSIRKENLFDGLETIKLSMSNNSVMPKPGNYTVVLESVPSRELLYKETHTYVGGNLTAKLREKDTNDDDIQIYVNNTGDLPIFVTRGAIFIDDNKIYFDGCNVDYGENESDEDIGKCRIPVLPERAPESIHTSPIRLSFDLGGKKILGGEDEYLSKGEHQLYIRLDLGSGFSSYSCDIIVKGANNVQITNECFIQQLPYTYEKREWCLS